MILEGMSILAPCTEWQVQRTVRQSVPTILILLASFSPGMEDQRNADYSLLATNQEKTVLTVLKGQQFVDYKNVLMVVTYEIYFIISIMCQS